MAYIHCHGCGWEQDDFWDFKIRIWWPKKKKLWRIRWNYNPFSQFLGILKEYWRPRYVDYDKWIAEDLGWKTPHRHSWQTIRYEFMRMCRKFGRQHWWTWKQYKRSKDKKCPKCRHGLCID